MGAPGGRRLWAPATIGRLSIALLLVWQVPVWSARPLGAQDIEALAEVRGLTLPQSYYDRVAQEPGAFELPNGLFRVNAQGRVEPVRNIGGTHRGGVAARAAQAAPQGGGPETGAGVDELGMSARASSGGAVPAGPDPRRLATNRGEKRETKPVSVQKGPGRNDPCPCGSGKKYKKCHGRA